MGSLRSEPAQGLPPDDLNGFPTTGPPGGAVYRAHPGHLNPWWFSSYDPVSGPPAGRFHLPSPRGTCYTATGEVGAAREHLGHHVARAVHRDPQLAQAVVSRLDISDWGEFADLEHEDAPLHGVTRELSLTGPYEQSAAWATALDGIADGIRHLLRFGIPHEGYALFGASGQHDDRPVDPEPRSLIHVLVEASYEVIDTPDTLPVVEPPH